MSYRTIRYCIRIISVGEWNYWRFLAITVNLIIAGAFSWRGHFESWHYQQPDRVDIAAFFIIWMICLVLCRPTTVLLSVSCYHRIVMYSLTDISGYLLLLCTTIHSIPLLYSVSSLEGNDGRMRWTSSWKSKRALSSFAWLASRCLATTDQLSSSVQWRICSAFPPRTQCQPSPAWSGALCIHGFKSAAAAMYDCSWQTRVLENAVHV